MRSTCSKSHTSRLRRHSSCRLMWLWILAFTCQGTHTIPPSVKQGEHTCAALTANYCLSVASGIFGVIDFRKFITVTHSTTCLRSGTVPRLPLKKYQRIMFFVISLYSDVSINSFWKFCTPELVIQKYLYQEHGQMIQQCVCKLLEKIQITMIIVNIYSGIIKTLIEVMLVIKKSLRSNLKLPPASFP